MEFFQPWHLMVLLGVVAAIVVVPTIFYILTLQRALEKCAPMTRTMEPGLVWLSLIPFVNLVFSFIVVNAMAKTLRNEFNRRAIYVPDPTPGQSIGIAMAVCACCTFIPVLGFLSGIAHLVLWVIYWSRIAEYSRLLDLPAQYAPYPANY